ncbi:leucine-rich repeat receptor protein kinase MSL1 [Setaria viridis]|uniref:leucine-rich repeat receptor protein kinase MSL1 n=1 Tax=Setaria viridis TaxID=4556 RepID=UPI003B3B22CC
MSWALLLHRVELKKRLAKVYEVKDPNTIFVFKFHTYFGGGKSTGFSLIYDNLEAAKSTASSGFFLAIDHPSSEVLIAEAESFALLLRSGKKITVPFVIDHPTTIGVLIVLKLNLLHCCYTQVGQSRFHKRHAASRRLSPLDGPPSPPSLRDRLVSPHHCLPAFIFMCPPGGVKVKLGVEMERKRGLSSATSRAGAPGPDSFSLFIIFVCFIASSAFAGSSDIENLYDLRDAVAKSKDSLSDWFGTETCPCNWRGITCEGDTVVAINLSSVRLHIPFPLCITAFRSLGMLNLSGCDLSGQIPEALGNLQQLQYLDLSSNQLAGPIPFSLYDLKTLKEIVLDRNSVSGQLSPAIGQLQNLTKLSISRNNISGELPPELGSLKNLEVLDLQLNRFNGSIPEAFGNLTRLFYLDASRNKLTGSIFPGISALLNLLTIDFSSNSLVGPIPNEITHLKMLERLALGFNHFTGGIPKEIGNMKHLKELSLTECSLSGTIPWSIGGLGSLVELDISGNDFNSELPASVGDLGNMTILNARKAKLVGRIPKQLGNCKKLTLLRLSFNSFTGSIPEELAGLKNIAHFEVEDNQLSGTISDWIKKWANVVSVNLGNNKFYGLVPPTICQAKLLQSLDLHCNDLTGSIKETFEGCKNLVHLDLQGNHFHGGIPEYLAKLPLTILDLSYNNFTGELPGKLFESSTFLELSLDNNNLTGHIPESIGKLHSLQRLRMGSNHLEGPIPLAVGALENLTEISLDGNRLSGSIPQELFNCRNLVKLNLSSNSLMGPIPRSISQLTSVTGLVLSHNQLSGSIPAEICGGFTNPTHPESEYVQHHGFLDLSYNLLSGRIPPAIKNCVILEELLLQGNLLNGSIPAEVAELKNITKIDLSFNALSLLCSKTLNRLDVSNNNLSGKIPLSCTGYGEWSSSLIFFNASSNHLSGSLDESISKFRQLSYLDIHNNSLTGSLPSALFNLSFWGYLDLSKNDFSGAIPCGICNISNNGFVNISGNNFGMHSLSDCPASGICAADSINRRGSHTPHVILTVVAICVAVTVVIVVLLVFFLRWKLLRNNRSLPLVPTTASQSSATTEPSSMEPPSINLATFEHALLRFTLEDILKATNNFSNVHIIGQGGFGTVYKAALPEGRRVAIKRLYGSHQFLGDRQFLAEMETIGKVKHRNLVPLLGYCARGDERFLIYEHMSHGSLETWLRDRANAPKAIGWPDRLRICIGSAHGLMFLHHGFVPRIIHRDMKSSNILLDENMEPRISDFGLARIISAYDTHVSTNVAGTLGYIPPEYAMTMKCTAKGDVFSFGVVMLEVLTGRPPTGQEGREGELFDPSLPVSGLWREQMVRVLAIALDCTADEPRNRPTMPDVVKGLKIAELMESEPHDLPGRVAQP